MLISDCVRFKLADFQAFARNQEKLVTSFWSSFVWFQKKILIAFYLERYKVSRKLTNFSKQSVHVCLISCNFSDVYGGQNKVLKSIHCEVFFLVTIVLNIFYDTGNSRPFCYIYYIYSSHLSDINQSFFKIPIFLYLYFINFLRSTTVFRFRPPWEPNSESNDFAVSRECNFGECSIYVYWNCMSAVKLLDLVIIAFYHRFLAHFAKISLT